jgi:alkanesulfonate monooxygenase SsuD/methylene tetrahydromethanopterin reductase-like flavin-dependent oxidoreductase (luciferase family)
MPGQIGALHLPRWPPESLPSFAQRLVLVGTTGSRAMKIAAAVADGVVLPEGSTPAAVRWARAAGGGRLVASAWLSLDANAGTALDRLRPEVEGWLAAGNYPRLAALAGVGDGPLDDDQLRELAVAGDPADCAAAVRALWDAGADSVVLVAGAPAALEQFASEVRPLL